MRETNIKSDSASGSILGWLGFGKVGKPSRHDVANLKEWRIERATLMAKITEFLLGHDLAITPANLQLAHRAFSGLDTDLLYRIELRVGQGKPISQTWLDDTPAPAEDDSANDNLEHLMVRLEADLDAFSKTAKAAHVATATYGEELAHHASELDQAASAGGIVTDLARLAKAMLERTRKVEGEMRRSENEAKELRVNLEEARQDADIDRLTGLPNRRAFEALLGKQCDKALASGEPLSIAFCDVDHFKQVNDLHGHDTGDRVLKAIAGELSKISNDHCHVARHGGEEFVMLFLGDAPAEARDRLDGVREKLSHRNFVNRKTDNRIGTVTFSAGVADVFAHADPSAALAAADEALYRAKNEGRNRILLAGG